MGISRGILGVLAVVIAAVVALALTIPASGAPGDPPDTIIDSGPSGPTNDSTPNFAFHSTEAGSRFECSYDTGTEAFAACPESPPTLADGTYMFRVRAVSGEQIRDASPATREFTVDTVPPDTIIDSGPSGETTDPTPTFTFHGTDGGAIFECSTDTGTPSFGPCATTAELEEGTYTFRVRATDPAGNTDPTPATRDFTLVILPPPVYGRTINLEPVSGTVRIKLRGGKSFSPLKAATQVKLGATLDVRAGRVHLVSAKSKKGPPQGADFYSGQFVVLQSAKGTPITIVRLDLEPSCSGQDRRSAGASGSKGNGLWGSGHGNFRSEGKHGSATVRGTIWFTEDRCDGTFFKVDRGVVAVKDFTRGLTVTLRAGSTYFARAP